MNAILAISMEWRLVALAVLGAVAGAAVNLAAAALTQPRPMVHPWVSGASGGPLRQILRRLPILGWLLLRREDPAADRAAGIRPILVELLSAATFAGLYWWEIGRLGLVPPMFAADVAAGAMAALHQQYAAHLVLGVLMLAASLTDMDEKIIPDAITVPGALLGLVLAAILPHSLLPVVTLDDGFMAALDNLQIASPEAWPASLSGAPQTLGLVCGCGCFLGWCVALLPRTWYARHGWRRALGLCCARLRRDRLTLYVAAVAICGTPIIYALWRLGGEAWRGLLCALVGMAFSGGLVWVIRVIGYLTLQREAMGFGDVTLMAMIGAFLGWQPCLIAFFVAPLPALLVGVGQLLAHRENEIPFGPFLCLGTLVVVVHWANLWPLAAGYFAPGWLIPLVLVACMGLMTLLLLGMRLLRGEKIR